RCRCACTRCRRCTSSRWAWRGSSMCRWTDCRCPRHGTDPEGCRHDIPSRSRRGTTSPARGAAPRDGRRGARRRTIPRLRRTLEVKGRAGTSAALRLALRGAKRAATLGRREARLGTPWRSGHVPHPRRGRPRPGDLGVVPLVPPAVDVSPPPGHVVVPAGTRASFRCGARVAAARPSDHLWFEWTVDGRTMSRHEEPATEAVSEFLLPVPEAGSHRVVVRVTENERSSSVAEWVLESAPLPERPARPAEPGPAPPAQLVEAPPAPPPAQAAE